MVGELMENREKTCPLMNKKCETLNCMWYMIYVNEKDQRVVECTITLLTRYMVMK